MRKGRANFFLEYNWHHNVILHEAGVPPIHTPLSVLKELVKELKDRLYLVRIRLPLPPPFFFATLFLYCLSLSWGEEDISEKTLPKDSGLRIAKEGVENSIIIDVFPHRFAEAIGIFTYLTHIHAPITFAISPSPNLPRHAPYTYWGWSKE